MAMDGKCVHLEWRSTYINWNSCKYIYHLANFRGKRGYLSLIFPSLVLQFEQDKNFDLESSGNEVGKKETSNL